MIHTLKYQINHSNCKTLYLHCKYLDFLEKEGKYSEIRRILIDEIPFLFYNNFPGYKYCLNIITKFNFDLNNTIWDLIKIILKSLLSFDSKKCLIVFDQYSNKFDPKLKLESIVEELFSLEHGKKTFAIFSVMSMNNGDAKRIKISSILKSDMQSKYLATELNNIICTQKFSNIKYQQIYEKVGKTLQNYHEISQIENEKELHEYYINKKEPSVLKDIKKEIILKELDINGDKEHYYEFTLGQNLPKGKFKIGKHNLNTTVLEGLLSRGDERVGDLILSAFKKGVRLDAWDEHLRENQEKWEEVFREADWNVKETVYRTWDIDEALPWDGVSLGPSKGFYKKEWKNSISQVLTPKCEVNCNHSCGICTPKEQVKVHSAEEINSISIPVKNRNIVKTILNLLISFILVVIIVINYDKVFDLLRSNGYLYTNNYNGQYLNINPIYTASIPIIKLDIDFIKLNNYKINDLYKSLIENDYYKLCLKNNFYTNFNIIKVDISMNSINYKQMNFIRKGINNFPQIKPLIKILKKLLIIKGMNNSYKGGMSSYCLFLIIYSYIRMQCNFYTSNNNDFNYGSLLIGFLFHYVMCIDFKYTIINPCLSNPFIISSCPIETIPTIIEPTTMKNAGKNIYKIVDVVNAFNEIYRDVFVVIKEDNNNNENLVYKLFRKYLENKNSNK